ncbi:Kinesin-like protein [Gryllus bimaculatus]|nr:Kinesin-like protein [Gryllus bimaculatus]
MQVRNEHLRNAACTCTYLHGGRAQRAAPARGGPRPLPGARLRPRARRRRPAHAAPPPVDADRLAALDSAELVQLVQLYADENGALRRENAELFSTRELLLRDQELVCRENERLLRKLEDVNSVCCRSPIIPARPTYSAEMLNMSLSGSGDFDAGASASTNVWTNSSHLNGGALPGPRFKQDILEGRKSARPPHRLPDSIQKELERRRIGTSMTNIADNYRERSHRRHNSWENGPGSKEQQPPGSAASASSTASVASVSAASASTAGSRKLPHAHEAPLAIYRTDQCDNGTTLTMRSTLQRTQKTTIHLTLFERYSLQTYEVT